MQITFTADIYLTVQERVQESKMSSPLTASKEKTNGTRLARLLVDGGTNILRQFLHSNIPPATTLQIWLTNNYPTLQGLKSRRALFRSQWEKLFPSSGDPPDSNTFDITLLHLLLREICNLSAPLIQSFLEQLT